MSQTAPSQAMQLKVTGLIAWSGGLAAAIAVAGIAPTLWLAGTHGLFAYAMAAGIVVAVMAMSAVLIFRAGARGPGKAAMTFVLLGAARAIASLVLAWLAWCFGGFAAAPLLIWVALFYMTMLAGESIWLTKALRREAFGPAIGRASRPGLS